MVRRESLRRCALKLPKQSGRYVLCFTKGIPMKSVIVTCIILVLVLACAADAMGRGRRCRLRGRLLHRVPATCGSCGRHR
jgi:hypothetical protein